MQGNRKFILMMTVAIGCMILCAISKMTGGECVTVLTTCVGAFAVANSLEHRFKTAAPGTAPGTGS